MPIPYVSRRGAVASTVASLVLLLAGKAVAICNLIPPAGVRFAGALGSVSQRVAAPGNTVRVSLTGCDPASTRFSPDSSQNAVTLEFRPPTGAANWTTVLLPTTSTTPVDCTCVFPACSGSDLCNSLDVTIPDTTGMAGTYGLAGPARLHIETNGQPSADVFQLAVPGKNCARGVEGVFETFTVLPQPNDFGSVASGAATEVLATVDATGSLLLPFDYLSVLPAGIGSPIARLLKGSAHIDAFPDVPGFQPIAIPSSSYVRSFTLDGRPLPPLLRVDETGSGLVGTADGDLGIIRVNRNDPNDALGDVFDLSSRLVAGKGPIVIDVAAESVTAEAQLTVPLRGLRPSLDVVAFARDEAKEGPGQVGIDLNGDGDTKDRVVQILDPRNLAVLDSATATSEVRSGGLGVPAIEAEGDLAAFLESEAAQNLDLNADGDRLDARLRVFRATGAAAPLDLSPVPAVLADGEPVINRRSLAISDGMVFFREPSSLPAASTETVSVDSSGNEATLAGGAANSGNFDGGVGLAVSTDGRFVAFFSAADNLRVPDPGSPTDIYLHDRVTHQTELVSISTAGSACGTPGRSIAVALSGDGQRIAFYAGCSDLVPGGLSGLILVHDRSLGETWAVTPVGADSMGLGHVSPSFSADGRFVALASDRSVLVPGDNNGWRDVFVFDVDACRIGPCIAERASVDSNGNEGNGASNNPVLSADGRFVAFDSAAPLDPSVCPSPPCAPSGPHIFVRDRLLGTTKAVDVTTAGLVTGFDSYRPAISADGRFVAWESRACVLSPAPCNGAFQYEIYVRDTSLGVTERVSLDLNGDAPDNYSEIASISADGRFVTFSSLATDLVPEGGTPGREHAYIRDRYTGSTERIDVAVAGPFTVEANGGVRESRISADGQTVVFVSDADNLVATAEASGPDFDVFARGPAPGSSTSRRLRVLRSATNDVVPDVGLPAAAVAVSGGRALVLPPADVGGNVLLYDPATDTAETLDVPGVRGALSSQVLAVTTPGTPFDLLHVRNVSGGGETSSTGVVADEIAVARRDVVVASPQDANPAVDSDGDGTPDDDHDRHLLRIVHYDPPTQTVIDVGQPVTDFEVDADPDPARGHLVAFRTRESDLVPPADLNQDGDTNDDVMQIYDLRTNTLISTGQAALRCDLPGCVPGVAYKVNGDTVSFLTRECDQGGPLVSATCPGGGSDLNFNGEPDEIVVQVFNTATGRSQVFDFHSGDGKPPTPFPDTTLGGAILYQTVRESDVGVDLNGNGNLLDTLTLIVGDQDGDGIFDSSGCISPDAQICAGAANPDICVEASNVEQLDTDLDDLGDVCDESPYCATYTPSPPPAPPASAAACQRMIGSLAQTYLRKRIAAQRACYKKIAEGKLLGDARALCRGSYVGDLEVLPTDEKTAGLIAKAAVKLGASLSKACAPEVTKLALLDTCASASGIPTVAALDACVRRSHGETANVLAELAYGGLGQIADPKGRRCQLAIGDSGTRYLTSALRAASSCLARVARGALIGDAQALCLGGRDETTGLAPPGDPKTANAFAKATTTLATRLGKSCADSASLLAARAACGTDAASVGECIECALWRRAMDLVHEEFGPS